MRVRKRFGQGVMDAPVGAGDRLGTDALDNIQRRQDDVSVPQCVEDTAGQYDALVGLQSQLGRDMDGLLVVRQTERLHAQVRPQFEQVFAPGFLALGILRPTCRVEPQLPPDPLQQGSRHGGVWQQSLAREAQQAQLHCDAQAIGVAAPLTDQRQIGLAEGVVPDEFVFGVGQGQQAVALSSGQDRTAGHVVSFFLKA